MKTSSLICVTLISLANLSLSPHQRWGMLTDDHGIVTSADLDEAEADSKCTPFDSSPSRDFASCHHYWMCLPTDEVYLDSEDVGETGDFEHGGVPDFWIKDGNTIHHFLTRRFFDMDVCRDWLKEWEEVMNNEEIVCLAGLFLDASIQPERPSDPVGRQYFWQVDRMKSHSGERSYFYRGAR